MKRFTRSFRWILLLGLAVIYPVNRMTGPASAAGPNSQAKSSTLSLPGLRGRVTITYDERAIPHIEAQNEDDLYFAQGYAVARDRLWQMDLFRRTARGELSEIFGRVALEEDKRRRKFGFAALAAQAVGHLASGERAAFEHYASGVNALIESLDDKSLPVEFRVLRYKPRPWEVADSLVIGKIFAETLSTSWQVDLMRGALADLPREKREALFPTTSPLDVIMVGSDSGTKKAAQAEQPAGGAAGRHPDDAILSEAEDIIRTATRSLRRAGFYAEDLAASNNWVVSGKHTVTGKPLLANDPHLSPSAPSIWYMAHLEAPGLHVAGVTAAGAPGILIGHNDRIAWGITNVESDAQDLYIETFDKDNPKRYQTPDGWRDAEIRREEIKVRKSPADPATEPVDFEVTVTRHGPIILDRNGVRYSLAWTALDPTTYETAAFYELDRARNWQEFRSALSHYSGTTFNIVYADADGHIGYWAAGRYPIRKTGDGTVPYDGATGAGDWTGYVPFEATPHVYDPPSGIIVTANNRIVGRDYPYYISNNWAVPYRARRICNLLTAKDKLSADDFRAIQSDTYSFPDATFVGEIVRIGRPLASSSDEWRQVLASFEGFDAMMKPDSKQMPLAFAMRTDFARRVLIASLGAEKAGLYNWGNSGTFFDWVITSRPREWMPKEFDSYESCLLACYRAARKSLTDKLGADESAWTWGRYFQVRFPHPLAGAPMIGGQFAIAPIPQSGGAPTVNRAGAVSMRLIADPADWDKTRQGIALGESGDPGSAHWKDQLADWQAVTPHIFPFSKKSVAAAARETLVLEPRP